MQMNFRAFETGETTPVSSHEAPRVQYSDVVYPRIRFRHGETTTSPVLEVARTAQV